MTLEERAQEVQELIDLALNLAADALQTDHLFQEEDLQEALHLQDLVVDQAADLLVQAEEAAEDRQIIQWR